MIDGAIFSYFTHRTFTAKQVLYYCQIKIQQVDFRFYPWQKLKVYNSRYNVISLIQDVHADISIVVKMTMHNFWLMTVICEECCYFRFFLILKYRWKIMLRNYSNLSYLQNKITINSQNWFMNNFFEFTAR